jgi:hypothetical protein
MNKPIHHDNSDNNITGMNLLLAQLLLKTTDKKMNLPDNAALLSIVQSLSKSSKLYFSRLTLLQWNPNVNAHSRAVSNSSTSSTCCDSLSKSSCSRLLRMGVRICPTYQMHKEFARWSLFYWDIAGQVR